MPVKLICLNCGKNYNVAPYEARRGRKFCSQKCFFDYAKKYVKRVKRICDFCGKEYIVEPNRLDLAVRRDEKHSFCSMQCKGKWQTQNLKGEHNPHYSERVKRICKYCGNEFEAIPSYAKRAIFCSRKCWYAWRKEHPKVWINRNPIREARLKQKFPNHHTQPELIFEQICEKHNLPFHYVGDGQLWIGKTKKLNPDFCELNGKKIVIEVMGDYWHSPLLNRKLREGANLNYRKRHYKKYGWESYFLWETDLKRPDAEQFVLSKLKSENLKYEEG